MEHLENAIAATELRLRNLQQLKAERDSLDCRIRGHFHPISDAPGTSGERFSHPRSPANVVPVQGPVAPVAIMQRLPSSANSHLPSSPTTQVDPRVVVNDALSKMHMQEQHIRHLTNMHADTEQQLKS